MTIFTQPAVKPADTGNMKASQAPAHLIERTNTTGSDIDGRRATIAAANSAAPAGAIWEGVPGLALTTDKVLHINRQQPELSATVTAAVVAILTRPLQSDEGHRDGYDNKERELRACFRDLTPADALLLRRRLNAERQADELTLAFKRLTIERRTRLLAFLADPRRGRT